MTKKTLLLFITILVMSGVVFAQGAAKNSAAIQATIFGAAVSYERILTPHFSLLADVSYSTLIIMNEFTLSGKGRWYPFGKALFFDLGLGYSYGRGFVDFTGDILMTVMTLGLWLYIKDWDKPLERGGFLIQPGFGWKIDIGQPDSFVLPISLGLDIKVGEIPDFLPFFRVGLGYSF